MKKMYRLLAFGRPFSKFLPTYFTTTTLSTIFNMLNFSLLIPVLNILFSDTPAVLTSLPEFSFSTSYFKVLFDHWFAYFIINYGKMGALTIICGVIVCSIFLANVFRYVSLRITVSMRTLILLNLRKTLFEKISSQDLAYFNGQKKGNLLSVLSNDVNEIQNMTSSIFQILLQNPIMLIGYLGLLLYLSPQLTAFSFLVLPLMFLVISRITKKLRHHSNEAQVSLAKMMGIMEETISGIKIIKAFGARLFINKKFDEENQIYRRIFKKISHRSDLAAPLSEFMGIFSVVALVLFGSYLVLKGSSSFSPSEMIAYIVVFSQLLVPLKGITTSYATLRRTLACGDRIFEIIDTPTRVLKHPNAKELHSFEKNIEFKNVHFAYNQAEVLKDINLTIEKGKIYALVGSSGAGKSTMTDLVPRFYDVTSGTILLDGIDIRKYHPRHLMNQMALVTQESILFNDTVRNNIAFGLENVSDEAILNAAKVANAHEFIKEMEYGYDTMIGDRGNRLSGGQRQRIAIARAVLKNPPIMILDEATSALDTESERLVQEALNKLMNNRTAIVVAHRLSTIQNADCIVVMEHGKIVEKGTHSELMQIENGVYKKLCEMQSFKRLYM